MFKKVLSIGLSCCMALALLSACGGADSQASSTATSTSGDASASTADKTFNVDEAGEVSFRFSWWGNDARHEATLEVINNYMELHPNVHIEAEYRGKSEREKVATELAGGQLADLVQLDYNWVQDFSQNGEFFVDLNTLDYIIDMSGFDMDLAKEYGEVDGKLYGLPTGVNARANLINVDLAEEFNIPTDLSTEWTWDDYLEIGKTVHEQDPEKYFLNADSVTINSFLLRPYLVQLTGNQLVQDDYTPGFTTEELAQALHYIGQLYEQGVVLPASEANVFLSNPWTNPRWVNGDFVTELTISSTMPAEMADMPGTPGAFIIPQMEGAKDSGITVMPSQLLAISNTCENPEVVADFMNYFFNDEEAGLILKDCRSIPPVDKIRELCAENDALDPVVVAATDYGLANRGMSNNVLSGNEELSSILQDACEQVAYDPDNYQAIAEDTMTLYNDVLATLKASNG